MTTHVATVTGPRLPSFPPDGRLRGAFPCGPFYDAVRHGRTVLRRAGPDGLTGTDVPPGAADWARAAGIREVALLPVAVLGFTMLARWLGSRRRATPESRFPVPVVIGHGLFAATTLVLVLLTALGVGVG